MSIGRPLSLEFSSEYQENIWQKVATNQCSDVARWNAYINYLCLDGFRKILSQQIEISKESFIVSSITKLSSLWEFLSGTKICLNNTNTVLIPSEGDDFFELKVPQEWIDIPTLAAQYYIAIQVNLDDQLIQVIGVTTHQTLKQSSQFDPVKRIYTLGDKHLFSLNVMLISQKLSIETTHNIQDLPKLSVDQVQNIFNKLDKITAYSPRLEIPFIEWGALLENEQWRTALYQRRRVGLVSVLPKIQEWLKRNFTEATQLGWFPELSPVYRSTDWPQQSLIEKLHLTREEKEIIAIAEKLGTLDSRNSAAIEALFNIIQVTQDETIRWDAALALGRIVPHHPSGAICCNKMFKLGPQQLRLRLAVRKEIKETVTILLQLESIETKIEDISTKLQNLTLKIFDKAGYCIETAKYDDLPLQLEATLGEIFSLQLLLGEFTIQENLAI